MFISSEQRNAGIAVAMAAMLLACCLVPMLASEDADAANETATVELRVGDTFSYAPQTKMASTFSYTGSAMASESGFLTYTSSTTASTTGPTVSGTAETAGTYTLLITATTDGSGQVIKQTITLTVYDRIAVDTTSSPSTVTALINEDISYSFVSTGPKGSGYTLAVTGLPSGLTYSGSTSSTSGSLSGTLSGSIATAGTYTVTFTLTSSNTNAADTVTYEVTINVFDDLTVSYDGADTTYVGESYSATVTTNGDTIGADDVTTGLSGGPSGLVYDSTTGVYSGVTVTTDADNMSTYYTDYTLTITATGTVGSDGATETVNASATQSLRVYASNEFTSAPTIDNIQVSAASTADSIILISASLSGATSVTVDWGDGSDVETIDPTDGEYTVDTILLDHEYADDGQYIVTITASNDEGDTVSKIVYDAGTGEWAQIIEDSDESFLDSYSLVLLLVGLVVLCAVIGYLRYPQAYYVAAVLAIAMIACLLLGVTGLGDL